MNGIQTMLISWACCLALVGCGGGGGGGSGGSNSQPQPDVTTPQPSITSFTASRSEIALGEEVQLNPIFENGTASIEAVSHFSSEVFDITPDPDSESIISGDLINVQPTEDTTYSLKISNGGASSSSQVSVNILRVVTISDASVNEGDSGDVRLRFPISIESPADGNIDVYFAVQDGTARSEIDFIPPVGVATIASGFIETFADIAILTDQIPEQDEALILAITSVTGNASLSTTQFTATGTIRNDDTAALNDTGIIFRGTFPTGNFNDCEELAAAGQDCMHGRDSDLDNNQHTNGFAGFDFTKLNSLGIPLAIQALSYEDVSWSCVQDNITGLIWEVKTNDGNLRDTNWTYTSFDAQFLDNDLSDNPFDGGSDGVWAGNPDLGVGSGSDWCYSDEFVCTTGQFVTDINKSELCGYSDWRAPKREELRSIINYNRIFPTIDTNYFPNTQSDIFSSNSPVARFSDSIWVICFFCAADFVTTREQPLFVRLVRGTP